MRNIILSIGILSMLAGMFVSCRSDDDEKKIVRKKENPQNTTQRSLSFSTYETVGIDLETKQRDSIKQNLYYDYDSEGRVVKIYDSNGYREDFDYKSLAKTTLENGVETSIGKLNVDGSIASDSALNGSYKKEYTYDENGYVKDYNSVFVVDEEDRSHYTYSYTWEDGNIVSCQVKDGGVHNGAAMELGVYDYQYEYTNETVTTPIENKSGLVFLFDNVMDFSYAFGKKCKNLPVAVNNQKIEWTLDETGYPVKVVTNKATATFTWK